MKRNNKRGLSEVVTSVIVILLVLVAIGIIWAVVNNLITKGGQTAGRQAECLNVRFDVSASSTGVIITRQPGGPASVTVLAQLVTSTGSEKIPLTSDTLTEFSSASNSTVTLAAGDIVRAYAKIGDFTCPQIAGQTTL